MIVRSHESKQWIVKPRLLQIEENWVNSVQRAEAPLGKPAFRVTRRLVGIWDAKLVLFLTAFLEDAQDVARLSQRKPRQGFTPASG